MTVDDPRFITTRETVIMLDTDLRDVIDRVKKGYYYVKPETKDSEGIQPI
jgi:hypothetical protein